MRISITVACAVAPGTAWVEGPEPIARAKREQRADEVAPASRRVPVVEGAFEGGWILDAIVARHWTTRSAPPSRTSAEPDDTRLTHHPAARRSPGMPSSPRVERHDTTLVVTLDRPEKLNAYDGHTLHAIAEAWTELDRDPALRAGVLTGAGDESFCVGADIEAVTSSGFGTGPFPELAENLADKPLIAAIDGRCLGGGVMLATGCDVRIAGEHALFGLPEARWNLPAQWLGALAEQLLPAHALELALWGDRWLPASRLHEMGWLSAVVPRGEALAEALRWGERVAAMAPRAVRHFKALLRARRRGSAPEALELGHRQARDLMRMTDTHEGAMAFRERRPPRWQDR